MTSPVPIAASLGVLSPDVLWPPNHAYPDDRGGDHDLGRRRSRTGVELVSVTGSDEPDDGIDDGNTRGDVVIVDVDTVRLRAGRR